MFAPHVSYCLTPLSPVACARPDGGSSTTGDVALSCWAHSLPAKGMFVHRTRTMAVATLALLNVFTLGAGAAVAHMLPPGLAALRIPATANGPLIAAAPVLAQSQAAGLPTAAGLSAMLGDELPAADTGPGVGIEVADAQT